MKSKMKKKLLKISIGLWLLTIPMNLFSQPGTLDTTFGIGGKVITQIGLSNDYALSVNILPDSSIITAGYYSDYTYLPEGNNVFLSKYHIDGTLDNGFGIRGIVKDTIGSIGSQILATAIQPDGKIVAIGTVGSGWSAKILLLRYNSNGTYDNYFGNGGIVITQIDTCSLGGSVAIQPNGKIIVSASIHNGTNLDFGLLRYNSDGTLDNSFGTGGVVISTIGSGYEYNSSLKIQSDGKFVLAGRTYTSSWAESKGLIIRFDANGLIDTTFGNGGATITSVGSAPGYCVFNDIALQSDGKIVSIGYSIEDIGNGNYDNKNLVVRYNSNGLLDSSFGANGVVLTDVLGGGDIANSIIIQPDEKILIAGHSGEAYPDITSYITVSRYNDNGVLDVSFGTDGIVTTNVSGYETNFANSIKLQADRKIIVAGSTSDISVLKNVALVRYDSGLNLGIEENNQQSFFTIYPNPTTGKVTISFSEIITDIEIFNILGEKISYSYNFNQQKKIEIDLLNFPKGIYFVKIYDDEKSYTEKIVMQ